MNISCLSFEVNVTTILCRNRYLHEATVSFSTQREGLLVCVHKFILCWYYRQPLLSFSDGISN